MANRTGAVLCLILCAAAAVAQVPTAIPNGLPERAFNIPDAAL